VEEYIGRLWESFPPARFLTRLISQDHDRGFVARPVVNRIRPLVLAVAGAPRMAVGRRSRHGRVVVGPPLECVMRSSQTLGERANAHPNLITVYQRAWISKVGAALLPRDSGARRALRLH
jgi:hypothetical protein